MKGGVIVAAPASGSGKTVFTLGLVRHLARSGVAVASAKTGPDYIDPAFHSAASGRPCLNLDPWAMRPSTLVSAALQLAASAEIVVCEGVMGLFDGATASEGSTADLAMLTGWPVMLVVDAHAQAASAAAVVGGFAHHRPGLGIAGVVFNRVGSDRHGAILREACALSLPRIPVLGCLPRTDGLVLPERHLGLVQAIEHPGLDAFLDHAADLVAEHVDLAGLRAVAGRAPSAPASATAARPLPPLGQRIAVADDPAFAFRYPLVIDGWRAAGAEILPFSPLGDQPPAADADAVYLPGGYPELHVGTLAANRRFLDGLRARAAAGAAVFGECGGYMVLGRGLIDADGHGHAMAGLLALETSFADRRLHLGYRRAELAVDCPLGTAGVRFRGHEFHYARIVREGPGQPLFDCADASGRPLGTSGLVAGSVSGSFVHLIDRDDRAP
ncbi:MAG: cobyrinate a,c-diamide synthase [Rhodospirillales bacterium]